MEAFFRPAQFARFAKNALDHALRAADISMGAEGLGGEEFFRWDEKFFFVTINVNAVGAVTLLEGLPIGTVSPRAHRIMQFKISPFALHLVHHRHHRGDADAACKEQMLAAALIIRKQIYGLANSERVANLHFIMQKMRTTAGIFNAQHADFKSAAIKGR